MEPVKPTELIVAARAADALVYVAGAAGVVAGALLFREGEVPFAIIAWVLTFIAGTVLRLAAWASRGIAQVMQRTARIEDDVAAIRRAQVATEPDERPGFGGWH